MKHTARNSTLILTAISLLILLLVAGFASAAGPTPTNTPTPPPDSDSTGFAGEETAESVLVQPVRVQYCGRSCFLIVAPDGQRFVIDPFLGLPIPFPEDLEADAVVISHTHSDHSAYWLVAGNPQVVIEEVTATFGMTTITGYPSLHGQYLNVTTDKNTIFVFEIGDVKLVHLGDFGEIEDEAVTEAIMDADVVFVPIGVIAGIPQHRIMSFMRDINAHTVVPMHWFYPGEGVTGGTVRGFKALLPDDVTVSEAGELLVEPDMPEQVVILKEWQLED